MKLLAKIEFRDVAMIVGVLLIGIGAGPSAAGACLFYLGVIHPVLARRL